MARKTFTQKMHAPGDLPKVEDVSGDPRQVARYGGPRLLVASPLMYNELMAKVPPGKLLTADGLRAHLAGKAQADATCPLTAGLFINICAHASVEPGSPAIPYWRTLKSGGELNEKYPEGIDGQRMRLEMEGHKVVQKGKRWLVEGYESCLWDMK